MTLWTGECLSDLWSGDMRIVEPVERGAMTAGTGGLCAWWSGTLPPDAGADAGGWHRRRLGRHVAGESASRSGVAPVGQGRSGRAGR